MGPFRTLNEVRAKFSEYAVAGLLGRGRDCRQACDGKRLEIGDAWPMAARGPGTVR